MKNQFKFAVAAASLICSAAFAATPTCSDADFADLKKGWAVPTTGRSATLDKLLVGSNKCAADFMAHAKKEVNSENLVFLMSLNASATTGDWLYKNFIASTATRMINLPGQIKGPLDKKHDVVADYDAAKAEIRSLVTRDTLSRFMAKSTITP